jgi:RNA polymerase sigma factor (sigma-70 family)
MEQHSRTLHNDVFQQVNAIRINDENVLRALYQNNFPKVEQYVLKNNGSTEQAKDIFQDAFIALWRNVQLDKFTPENETALDGYLYRISKNKWLDYLRSGHYKKVVQMNDHMAEPLAPAMPEENEYINSIKQHFKQLGENCREVLARFYYHNESMRSIAATMGWTEETTRNNKYRCLQKLKAAIHKN